MNELVYVDLQSGIYIWTLTLAMDITRDWVSSPLLE